MKRRMFAAVLAAAMIVSLSACGGTGSGSASNPDGSASNSSGAASSQPDASLPVVSLPDVSTPDLSQPDASIPGGSQPDASEPIDFSLTLNKTEVTLKKAGATFQLNWTVNPVVEMTPTFTSSDETVAKVNDQGKITAVAPGTAVITVEQRNITDVETGKHLSAACTVTCDWKDSQPAPAPDASKPGGSSAKVTLNSSSITLSAAGETYQLTAAVEPKSSQKLEFYSSNPKVATVSAGGLITAVAPGKVTVTVACGGASAIATVNCSWTQDVTPPAKQVDLSAFYSSVTGKYEFGSLELADSAILDMTYSGMSNISAEQMLVYVCMMSMNNGEFGLVQVKDSKDVDTVKKIFQARIDYMVGDGNGPGGAQYPMAMDQWEFNSRIVSNGSYVMMIVHENCDDIVKEFNALF